MTKSYRIERFFVFLERFFVFLEQKCKKKLHISKKYRNLVAGCSKRKKAVAKNATATTKALKGLV